MLKADEEPCYLSAGELAEVLGIGDVEIARLARRGILPRIADPEKPRYFLYPLKACAGAYIRHLKSAAQRDRDAFWKAKAKSEKQRARLLTNETDSRAGRLMDAGEVEARERELAVAIRARLALIPLRLADRFGNNGDHGDRLAIEVAAEAEINDALLSLSEIGQQVSELSGSDPAPR